MELVLVINLIVVILLIGVLCELFSISSLDSVLYVMDSETVNALVITGRKTIIKVHVKMGRRTVEAFLVLGRRTFSNCK